MKKKSVVFLGLLGASGINCLAADASTQRMIAVGPHTTDAAGTQSFARQATIADVQSDTQAISKQIGGLPHSLNKKQTRNLKKARYHLDKSREYINKIS